MGDRHISVLRMTRTDLLAAADLRERRAAADIGVTHLWRALAARLEDDEAVGDRFTPADIDALSESVLGGETARATLITALPTAEEG